MKHFLANLVGLKPSSPTPPGRRLEVESLESRNLMAASISLGGTQLQINGSDHDDEITITQVSYFVTVRDTQTGARLTREFDGALVKEIFVDAKGGSDIVRNDAARPSTILGGTGNDLLIGGNLVDTIYGGDGIDSIYGRDGKDSLFGEDDDDLILGGKGGDYISGGSGNDILVGESDSDLIYGDSGDDDLLGDSDFYSPTLSIADNYGRFRVQMVLDTDLAQAPQDINFGNDLLDGGSGADRLCGSEGDDTLLGGSGGDSLEGDRGNDSLDGGDGADGCGGGLGKDIIHGGAGDDILEGDDGNDTLYGDLGNDFMMGGNGDDVLFGGEGTDTMFGNDFIVEEFPDHGFFTPPSALTLTGSGHDTIYYDLNDSVNDTWGALLWGNPQMHSGTFDGYWRYQD